MATSTLDEGFGQIIRLPGGHLAAKDGDHKARSEVPDIPAPGLKLEEEKNTRRRADPSQANN